MTISDGARLRGMIDGYQVSQAIAVAAELGISDLLEDGPKDAGELAQAVGADPRSLGRLLGAAAAVGVFSLEGDGRFGLTPLGERLRSDGPDSVRALAMQAGHPSNWAAWGDLRQSVRTGGAAFRHVHGMGAWAYREQHPEAGKLFDEAMATTAQEVAAAIAAAYDFDGAGLVVDVGGGRGALLAAILAAYPAMGGILFDRPGVVGAAEPLLQAAGVADRCTILGGDFFGAVPAGGDLYVLKGVIHDWNDGDATRILQGCRRAMRPDGKLLLVEQVLPSDGAASPFARFMDLHMLVIHGAGERTADDLSRLLSGADFRLTRIVSTRTSLSLIEAHPTP